MSTVTLGGNPVNVAGSFPTAGTNAADFNLTGKDLK
ncbi:MAG: lipid hydroperoxide peroxidase, partial [Betaproteobacteria bacterium]